MTARHIVQGVDSSPEQIDLDLGDTSCACVIYDDEDGAQ